jgi:hypothetical protein
MMVMMTVVLFLLALKAMFPVAGSVHPVMGFYPPPIRTGIRIMIHFTMMRVVFFRICMEWFHFCHETDDIQM